MKRLLFIMFMFFSIAAVKGQYELQFGQLIKTIEFINPGYNAVQNEISGTMLYNNQWNGFPGSPTTGAASFHMPFPRKHFGLGALFLTESIGLRDLQTAAVSIDADVRLANEMYMTAGILAGYQLIDYKIEDGNSAYVEAVSDIYNYGAPIAGAGLNLFFQNFHLGGSAYYQFAPGETELMNLLTVYGNISYWIKLSKDWRFKTMGMFKSHGVNSSILEAGAFVLFKDWIWLGGSYRVNASAIVMADLKITNYMRLGYSYMIDAGELANFTGNSHEIQLQFTIPRKSRNLLTNR